MNKFPGFFLIESPKVDFITILDTHGAIPWRDSMDLVYSMEDFPGNFKLESGGNAFPHLVGLQKRGFRKIWVNLN